MINDLDAFLKKGKKLLVRASADKRSPMHTPVLGTVHQGLSFQRTIVLRKYESELEEMLFYTDIRSDKISHLKSQPKASLWFYNPKKKIQIRIHGTVRIHQEDALCRQHWNNIPPQGRISYAARSAPGSPLEEATDDVDPEIWHGENKPSREETDYTFAHFAILRFQMEKLDMLLLDYGGHHRAEFELSDDRWKGQWVVP